MKKPINAFDHAATICNAMKQGVLLTTKNDSFVNTMTIGWGHIGVVWGRPVFIAFVRESRHTKTMLENHGEFTVNVPTGSFDRNILGFCGTKSGRDIDKIQALGLTLEESDHVTVPGIKELPLTLECKVIYKQKQNLSAIPEDIIGRYYPEIPGADFDGQNRDYHYVYYGEILGAYIIEE